jgi:predicted transcriptional regulator
MKDVTIMNRIDKLTVTCRELDKRIEELDKACEYPYKAGAMKCVNRSLDIWEITKGHQNKIDSANRRHAKTMTQVIKLIASSQNPLEMFETVQKENGYMSGFISCDYDYFLDELHKAIENKGS